MREDLQLVHVLGARIAIDSPGAEIEGERANTHEISNGCTRGGLTRGLGVSVHPF